MSFDDTHLNRLSEIISKRTGLNTFDRGRSRLIETLKTRAESIYDPAGYVNRLELLPENHPVWQALLAELTVGETYFMRDEAQIESLRAHILPSIIQHKRQQGDLTLRLWSAGCATGEEAYSLAALVHELLPDRQNWHIHILGTDINEAALEIARAGIYREWSFRSTPENFRHVYFILQHKTGSPPTYLVRPELRAMTRFENSNLINPYPFLHPQDLALCRNVLIYFTAAQAARFESHLFEALAPNAWLMLGPAELLQETRRRYTIHRTHGVVVYHKRRSTAPLPRLDLPQIFSGRGSRQSQEPVKPTIPELSDGLYRAAVVAVQTGNLLEAMQLAQQSLLDHADSATLHTLLASLYASRGETISAQVHLNRALAVDMLNPDAHYLLALIQMESGDYDAARISLRAAIYCRPDFALAHLLSGDLFSRQGDPTRAISAWTNARRLAGDLPPDLPLSDITDITTSQLVALAESRLRSASKS